MRWRKGGKDGKGENGENGLSNLLRDGTSSPLDNFIRIPSREDVVRSSGQPLGAGLLTLLARLDALC